MISLGCVLVQVVRSTWMLTPTLITPEMCHIDLSPKKGKKKNNSSELEEARIHYFSFQSHYSRNNYSLSIDFPPLAYSFEMHS